MRWYAHRVVMGGLVTSVGLLGAGCGGPPPPATSPVIVTTPTTVCVGDNYRTRITLDGTQSTGALTLVPSPVDAAAPPLKYLWTLSGSPYHVVDGSVTASKLVVTIAGSEPLQIDLNVQNGSGGSADSMATVSVTLLDDGICPLGDAG